MHRGIGRRGKSPVTGNEKKPSSLAGALAIVAVVAYLGLELHGLHRARDSMEPASIFRDFVGARHAVDRCGADAEERAAFDSNFAVVESQALRDLAARNPQSSDAEHRVILEQQRRAREEEVDALIAREGCAGKDVWRLLKLHEVRSRLNLGD
jgi:hypothetical protein